MEVIFEKNSDYDLVTFNAHFRHLHQKYESWACENAAIAFLTLHFSPVTSATKNVFSLSSAVSHQNELKNFYHKPNYKFIACAKNSCIKHGKRTTLVKILRDELLFLKILWHFRHSLSTTLATMMN